MQSTYLKQQDLLWLKGNAPASALTTLYFGLLDASDVEVTATYVTARASLDAVTGWSAISTEGIRRMISSALDVNFGVAIATGSIPKIGIYTAATAGDLIGIFSTQDLIGDPTPLPVSNGESLVIPSGDVKISFLLSKFTTYFIDLKLNWLKGTNYPTPPTTLYAAIGTITRQAIAWSANIAVGDNLEIRNTNTLSFLNAGADETVSAIAVYDALTVGNKIAETAFSEIVIATETTKQILPDALRIQV